ncbi:MAG: phosphoribosylformylglycinamidine synthase subunit PurQ, partial [Thermoproteota archaeon]|nr:phosphoribosylformylglycinamidine synthase subunit PurQ [Thermoproteota archaeon]
MVKIGITVFPGSNCDRDVYYIFKTKLNCNISYIEDKNNIKNFDAIIIPGGFTYGDRLRAGAIAAHSPMMDKIKEMAENDAPILGICNGFQILVESGLLPGALIHNKNLKFVCRWIDVIITNNETPFTNLYERYQKISIPIAHGEGQYVIDKQTYTEAKNNNQIIMKYDERDNPNGSTDNIAAICNLKGNVMGMMPHPERASDDDLTPYGFSTNAIYIFKSLLNYVN